MTLKEFLVIYDNAVQRIDDNVECCGQEGDMYQYDELLARAKRMRAVGEDIRTNYQMRTSYAVFLIVNLLQEKGVLEDFRSILPSFTHDIDTEIESLQVKRQALAEFMTTEPMFKEDLLD